jgi:Flp pilus assembly pilin Flp
MSNPESFPELQERRLQLQVITCQAGGDISMNMTNSQIPDFIGDDLGMTTVEYAVAGLMVALAVLLAFSQLTLADILEWIICLFQPL